MQFSVSVADVIDGLCLVGGRDYCIFNPPRRIGSFPTIDSMGALQNHEGEYERQGANGRNEDQLNQLRNAIVRCLTFMVLSRLMLVIILTG